MPPPAPAPAPLAATWRLITEPLRSPVNDWDVTDAEADLAQRRLAALDDEVFDGIVHRMATVEGGKFLRRIVTETEEQHEAPEAVRALVARIAVRSRPATARACLGILRGHALGRFLDALARIDVEPARRAVRAAGGPDMVFATAIEEAVRARAAVEPRSTGSLGRGLRGMLKLWAPATEEFRDFARSFAAKPRAWPGPWAEAIAAAIDRAASSNEAEGPVYVRPPELPPPFDEDFGVSLVDAIRARRPHAPPPFQPE